ncbi:MAG TPA: neutral/alkaline non-lysosomal ceramidase N-terminal domain-containing protein [Gemmataceae bacterium]|nr:neutral/alkaline non-lysosomal ceramidase N-terminal domain-containing protein [Gemmataceae bacterium]
MGEDRPQPGGTATEAHALTAGAVSPGSKRRWGRRLLAGFLAAAVALLAVIGPWPADNSSYVDSDYQRRSLQTLTGASAVNVPDANLSVGVAEADISPPEGHPLAGFSGRKDKAYHGIHSRCFVRALTVEARGVAVTVLTADLLLINAKLARAVLEGTGLSPGQVYFTASHTHSGPGGWGDHPLEKLLGGRYDPAFFARLVDTMVAVVRRSRTALTPAELAVVSVKTLGRQRNRLNPSAPTDDRLTALVFRRPPPVPNVPVPNAAPLAMLVVFSAHPTMFSQANHRLSADYPGELVAQLRAQTGCRTVMFAAGAVGETTVIRNKDATEEEQARVLGKLLAGDLCPALAGAPFERHVTLADLYVPVMMPPPRVHVSAGWTLSPVCTGWLADRQTHVHALRVGPALLVGFPGDYSGQLALRLAAEARRSGLTVIATSFNGDYKGYFVSRESFINTWDYETRLMNFYGPWAGEYLTDIASRMLQRLASWPDR